MSPAPRKPASEQTTAVLGLRLTAAERRRVEAAARKTGQSFSAYAREALVMRLLLGGGLDACVAQLARSLHRRARQLADDAAAADSRDGSGAAVLLERAAILREVGDSLIASVPEEFWTDEEPPPSEGPAPVTDDFVGDDVEEGAA